MEKRSIKSRLTPQNNYSIFAIEKPELRKHPLKDYTDTTFRSAYHKTKMEQVIQIFQKLNSLTVAEYFKYLGVEIDEEANSKRGEDICISTPDSKVKVFVIPTNEELVIARDTKAIAG